MLVAGSIWLLIGAGFGWSRARARYYEALLVRFREGGSRDYNTVRTEAIIAASLEFMLWTLLGLISGISYFAWILIAIMASYKKEIKKTGFGDAIVISLIIFILGAIAMGRKTSEWRQFELINGRDRAILLVTQRRIKNLTNPNEPRNEGERDLWKKEDDRYEEAVGKRLREASSAKVLR